MPSSKGFDLGCEEASVGLAFEEFTIFALQSGAKASDQMIYAVCQISLPLRTFLADVGLSFQDHTNPSGCEEPAMQELPEDEVTLMIRCVAAPAKLKTITDHYKGQHFGVAASTQG